MKSILSVAFSLFLFMAQTTYAQSYVFKVLANKGGNEVKSGGGSWSPLKTGEELKSSDQVKVSDGSYVGLMHNSGKTMEMKTPGVYEVSKLASSLKSKNSSLASKYADFVMNQSGGNNQDVNANYKQNLSVTGAVDRALASNAAIKVMAHSSSEVLNPEVVLRWNQVKTEDKDEQLTYVLHFMNLFDEEVATKETQNTSYTLHMDEAPFDKLDGHFVKVKVSVKGYDLNSGEYAISEKPGDESASIEKDLRDLKSEIDTNTAMNQLVLAAFYEKHDLLLDALTCYENAIKMEPDVDAFKDAYANFLMRNGFGK